jgi:hypothetical protein
VRGGGAAAAAALCAPLLGLGAGSRRRGAHTGTLWQLRGNFTNTSWQEHTGTVAQGCISCTLHGRPGAPLATAALLLQRGGAHEP